MKNKLSDKDKKDWEKFVKGHEKVENKDTAYSGNDKKFLKKTIDLHGYTLEEANKKIIEYIENCYLNNIDKINIITGKGLRSKNIDDPYQSNDLSILKITTLQNWIYSYPTTAGSRALMIGIALGIIGTSFRIIIGKERSFLGE